MMIEGGGTGNMEGGETIKEEKQELVTIEETEENHDKTPESKGGISKRNW